LHDVHAAIDSGVLTIALKRQQHVGIRVDLGDLR